MRSQSIHNPENIIYVFDKKEYKYFTSNGTDTVRYLPLAGAPGRISRLLATNGMYIVEKKYSYDISFV